MVLTKAELIGLLQTEVRILTHLCSKVKPEMLDYRPTPNQRSTIELLRYLTIMGPVLVPSIKAGAFLRDQWTAAEAKAKTLGFDAVVKSLESQAGFYADAVNGFSDAELREGIDLFGQSGAKMSRGQWLVNMVVSGHAAYRTQLFCYLKSCGREELNTMNLWAGMDAQM